MKEEAMSGTKRWPVKLARLTVDYPYVQEHERRGGHRLHDLVREVRQGVGQTLSEAIGPERFEQMWRVRASTGRGAAWANVCWFAAMHRGETESARDGRYLALLCDGEGRHFVQAIVWGTAAFRARHVGDGEEVRARLRARRGSVASWLRARADTAGFEIDADVDLSARSELARDYEVSCLIWRRYDVGEDVSGVETDLLTLSGVYRDMVGGQG